LIQRADELKPVRRGDRWRIQISRPDYKPRFFGDFDSEADGHLKAPRRGDVFRQATLRRFCVPSDPTLRNRPCLFAASVGYTTFLTFMTPQIPNKQQTNIKQKTNNHPVLNAAKAARGPIAWGVRHE
jgi:hypothetical protein